MKKGRKLKLLFFSLLALIAFMVAGVATGWHLLTANLVRSKIDSALERLPSNISVAIGNLTVNRSFPHVVVELDNVSLTYDSRVRVQAHSINDRLSIIDLIKGYLIGKPYYGSISIGDLSVEFLDNSSGSSSETVRSLPIIPVDINIETLRTLIGNHRLAGSFRLLYNALEDADNVEFNGLLDDAPLTVSATVEQKHIDARFSYSTSALSFNGVSVSHPRGSFSVDSMRSLSAHLNFDRITYKSMVIKKPKVDADITLRLPLVEIVDAQLLSSNGYSVSLTGTLNTKELSRSQLHGQISTGEFDIEPFVRTVGKDIKHYLLGGKARIEDVTFEGTPSDLSFIRQGRIFVSDVSFRVARGSATFFVRKGSVTIEKKKIVATGEGNFDRIRFRDSSMTIYRKPGFPCDMEFHYRGNASEISRIFLEKNILSESDLKTLGKTRMLKGAFSATTVVKNYRWAPKPYFYFDVIVDSRGISFYNSNIPGEYIKTYGRIEIKRVPLKNGGAALSVRLKDFRAQGLFSSAQTEDFTIKIKPKLGFYGGFKARLSRNDFSYLVSNIFGFNPYPYANSLEIEASLRGNRRLLHFSCHLFSRVRVRSKGDFSNVELTAKGVYQKPILSLQKVNLNNSLELGGTLNTDSFAYRLRAKANNFNIAWMKAIYDRFWLQSGLLSGIVDVTGKSTNLQHAKGSVVIKNGSYNSRINRINATVRFNGDTVSVVPASLAFDNQTIQLTAFMRLNRSLRLQARANRIVIKTGDREGVSLKLNPKTIRINVPQTALFVTLNVGKLIIKSGKKSLVLPDVFVQLVSNYDNSDFRLISPVSSIYLKRRDARVDITIDDRRIFAFLTGYKGKDNRFTLKGRFVSKEPYIFSLATLRGGVDVLIRHGEFRNVSNFLKVINITNIIGIILGKAKVEKHLPYDKIEAHLELSGGVLKTRKNTLAALYGSNLNIFAAGRYNIVKNYLDIYATFTTFKTINNLISRIPIIGWVIGGKERSFTGINVHIVGTPGGKISVKPVPLKGLSKGFLGILKRTLMLPLHIFGVEK